MKPGLVLATLPLFPGNLRSFHMSHKIITATLVLKRPMRALQGLKCLDSHHKSQWKEYYPCVNSLSLVTFVPMILLQISYLHLHSHHTQASSLLPLRVPNNFADMGFSWSCSATIASLYLALRVWALILSRYLNFT